MCSSFFVGRLRAEPQWIAAVVKLELDFEELCCACVIEAVTDLAPLDLLPEVVSVRINGLDVDPSARNITQYGFT